MKKKDYDSSRKVQKRETNINTLLLRAKSYILKYLPPNYIPTSVQNIELEDIFPFATMIVTFVKLNGLHAFLRAAVITCGTQF